MNWRYVTGDPFSNNHSDWRYRYNAMGEREQKRLYHAPLADSIAGSPYPWVYYLLGGSKDQLAVWHGQQMTSPFCDTVKFRNVFLYPTEYITHGVEYNGVREDIGQLVMRPDGSKQLRFLDHLASVRASIVIGDTVFSYSDYDPWGKLLSGSIEDRRSFNSRERDKESGTYNNGVRKYEEGRFLSVDPLWSKFESWSPYVYCYDNPLTVTDPQGMQGGAVFDGFDPMDFYDDKSTEIGGGPMGNRGGGMSTGEFFSKVWRRVVGSSELSQAQRAAQSSARSSAQAHVNMERNSAAASQAAGRGAVSQSVTTKSSGGGTGGGNSGSGGVKQTGSYTNTHQSGKRYHGKGGQERSQKSGKRIAKEHNDPHTATDWKPSANNREAFKDEARRIRDDGGIENSQNYNRTNSPGAKYLQQDDTP